MDQQITVYGADWCGDTRRTLRQLDQRGLEYNYIDVDENAEGEKKVIAHSNGKRRIPLVEISSEKGNTALAVPSESELDSALGK